MTSKPQTSDCDQLNQPLLETIFPRCQKHRQECQMESFGQCLLDHYPQTRGAWDIFITFSFLKSIVEFSHIYFPYYDTKI